MKPSPKITNSKRTDLCIALALGLFAFLVFANSIGNDYNLDDELVTNHQRLTTQGITAIPEIFNSSYYDNQAGSQYEYRPVTLTTFAIEHTFFDESPAVSHAINVLLYALTIILLYLTLRSVLPGDNFAVALIASLLFAVHPLHTEVVASIKNRDEILCFLGGTLSWYYAVRFLKGERNQWLLYGLFIFFFAFGILSKRSILSYAFVIPISLVWFGNMKSGKLLLVTFPLAGGFYLLSPSSKTIISLVSGCMVISFPFALKALLYQAKPGINLSGSLHIDWKSLLRSDENPKGQNMPQLKYSVIIAWSLLYGSVSVYLLYTTIVDWRVSQLISIAVAMLLAFISPIAIKRYATLVTVLLFLVLGFNYGISHLVEAGMLVLGILLYTSRMPVKILVGVIMLVTAMVHYCFWSQASLVTMSSLLLLLAFFFSMRERKGAVLIVVIYLLGALFTYIKFPSFSWVMPFVFAITYLMLFYKNTKSYVLSWLLVVSLFVAVAYIIQPQQYNRLHSKYGNTLVVANKAAAPNTTNNMVPAAGRKLDKVENPLIFAGIQQKSATAFVVMGKYLQLLLYPITLRFYYGYNQIEFANWAQPAPWIVLILLGVSFIAAFRFRLKYSLLALSVLLLWMGLFFISNLAVLVAGVVAERLAFVVSFWFCLAMACVLVLMVRKQPVLSISDFTKQPLLVAFLLAITVGFSFRSIARNGDWKDRLTLYSHDIKDLPNSAKAQQLLGVEYLQLAGKTKNVAKQNGLLDSARFYLTRSIEIAPDFHSPVYNLAYVYLLNNDCDSSIVWMKRSLTVEPNMSGAIFNYNIAKCYDGKNNLDSAARYYENAIATNPKELDYYTQLGYVRYRQGNLKASIAVNVRAIKQFPAVFDLYINTAKSYLTLNDNAAALPWFEGAFELQPTDANLALMIADLSSKVGNRAKAEQYKAIAAKLKGGK